MANTDGVPQGNTDGAEKPEESNDSSGTFNWDDFDSDVGAINLDLSKVGSIPGSSKQSVAETTAEILRRHQWLIFGTFLLKTSHLNMLIIILSNSSCHGS